MLQIDSVFVKNDGIIYYLGNNIEVGTNWLYKLAVIELAVHLYFIFYSIVIEVGNFT